MSTWEPPTGPISIQPAQPAQPGRSEPRGGRVGWVVALLAVAVLLGVLALWAGSVAGNRTDEADRLNQTAARADAEAKQLTAGVDGGNDALSDPDGTHEVVAALTTAVEATFSYDYTNLASTESAVEKYLTDGARCVYEAVFSQVRQLAPQQKTVLRTTVRQLAVTRLAGDSAEVLVYIDQTATRADTNNTAAVGGQFVLGAQRDGETWKITKLDFLDQPLFDGEPAPSC
jgi:type II secretory pathway pseudopilin PulG